MASELVPTKEARIAKAVEALDEKELQAYRCHLKLKGYDLSEDTANELFVLFLHGSSCDEIRQLHRGIGLGSIVAARIAYDWDNRRAAHREKLEKEAPARAVQTQLETVDFLGDMLLATYRMHADAVKMYISTGDKKHLDGVPLPKNVKEIQVLVDMFMKSTGQDQKKKVEVSGSVSVKQDKKGPVSSEEAAAILDRLLEREAIDVEVAPVEQPKALPPANPNSPKTPEEMVEYLVNVVRMERRDAEKAVESMKGDISELVRKYSDLAASLVKKRPLN